MCTLVFADFAFTAAAFCDALASRLVAARPLFLFSFFFADFTSFPKGIEGGRGKR